MAGAFKTTIRICIYILVLLPYIYVYTYIHNSIYMTELLPYIHKYTYTVVVTILGHAYSGHMLCGFFYWKKKLNTFFNGLFLWKKNEKNIYIHIFFRVHSHAHFHIYIFLKHIWQNRRNKREIEASRVINASLMKSSSRSKWPFLGTLYCSDYNYMASPQCGLSDELKDYI